MALDRAIACVLLLCLGALTAICLLAPISEGFAFVLLVVVFPALAGIATLLIQPKN